MNRSRFSSSQHLVHLAATGSVFGSDWALSCITAVYDHILFGPDTMVTRTMALNSITAARFRVLAELPKHIRDREKERCQ